MKKEAISYILMLIIALFPIMTACGGDDDDVTVKPPVNTNTNEEVTSPESNDNYYVKYEVEEGSQNSYGRAERTVVYKDVKELLKAHGTELTVHLKRAIRYILKPSPHQYILNRMLELV